jgi:Cdc6-like AAA superfamily ATPase
VIDTEGLQEIAEAATGDARVAIGILRKAARNAQKEKDRRIRSSVIANVVSEAKLEIERDIIDRLTPHQKVLYDIIHEVEQIAPPALYEEYRNRVDDPKTQRTVRNHLSKLEHYNLIVADGNTKARTYHSRT